MICMYFALFVTMSGQENDCKNDQKIVFVRCRSKAACPPPNRQHIVNQSTHRITLQFSSGKHPVNFFYACFPRFPSSIELRAKGSNLHTRHIAMLPTPIHMSDLWSWTVKDPTLLRAWLAYMSNLLSRPLHNIAQHQTDFVGRMNVGIEEKFNSLLRERLDAASN